jgi:hypothetical protein
MSDPSSATASTRASERRTACRPTTTRGTSVADQIGADAPEEQLPERGPSSTADAPQGLRRLEHLADEGAFDVVVVDRDHLVVDRHPELGALVVDQGLQGSVGHVEVTGGGDGDDLERRVHSVCHPSTVVERGEGHLGKVDGNDHGRGAHDLTVPRRTELKQGHPTRRVPTGSVDEGLGHQLLQL